MKLYLKSSLFENNENLLVDYEKIKIYTFTFSSGVEAVKIKIENNEFIWLPFFGQELWSWKINGEEQKFKGFLEEPNYDAKSFLENYGAFLINCGITSMGNPTKEDTHPHHGELALAKYKKAWIEFSDNDDYPISLCGELNFNVPFIAHYSFSPALRIYKDGTAVHIDNTLTNLQNTDLEYMYLSHLNFSMDNVDKIEYGVKDFSNKNVSFVDSNVLLGVDNDPSLFLQLSEIKQLNPELVAIIKNDNKITVNKLYKKDGSVIWTVIDTSTLNHTVAWLSKTPDRSACGFSLPSTAGPRGYMREKELGNIKILNSGKTIKFQYVFGIDKNNETIKRQNAIRLLGGSND